MREFPRRSWSSPEAGARKRSGSTTWKPKGIPWTISGRPQTEKRIFRTLSRASGRGEKRREENPGDRKEKCFYVPAEEIKVSLAYPAASNWVFD